jgi:hypothetical protein
MIHQIIKLKNNDMTVLPIFPEFSNMWTKESRDIEFFDNYFLIGLESAESKEYFDYNASAVKYINDTPSNISFFTSVPGLNVRNVECFKNNYLFLLTFFLRYS